MNLHGNKPLIDSKTNANNHLNFIEFQSKLDGKIELGKPNFVYTINGKPGELVKSYEEKYIFDKNMM